MFLDRYYIYYINDENLDKEYELDKYQFGTGFIMQDLSL